MKQQEKPIVAMIYDFDGTLAPGNMQEYDFLKEIGIEDKDDFWREVVEMQKEQDAPEVITYMRMMIEKSNNPENPRPITKNAFKKYGATIPLFKGVREWFALTRKLGEAMGIQIEHYINSSGLQEMVEGSPIGHEFKHIYASRFMYDKDGRAVWPAAAIDFTAKMQILYMINKGVERICDNKEINNILYKLSVCQYSCSGFFGCGKTLKFTIAKGNKEVCKINTTGKFANKWHKYVVNQ